MIDGGVLTVTLSWRDGRRRTNIDAPPRVSLARLLAGKPAAEAARLAGLVAESCATAHEAAARAAFGLAPRPADGRRMAAEALREHAARCLVGWPVALGMPRATPPEDCAETCRGAAALEAALFGDGGLPDRIDALDAWMRRGETTPARVLDHVWRRWDGRWGRADLPLWRPGETAAAIDFDEAELDGAPFDISVAARVADCRLMREVEARRGRGLAWRLLARLVDADRLLRGLRDEGPLCGSQPLGSGLGAAEAAGGAVLACASLRDGRVTGFAQLTPTDCALHPEGLLRRMLDSLPQKRAAPAAALPAMVLEAVDVRAPTRLVVDAAPAADAGPARRIGAAAS